nr:MAG TPA: hypothetical protein [Caudoviricetes sp.]
MFIIILGKIQHSYQISIIKRQSNNHCVSNQQQ